MEKTTKKDCLKLLNPTFSSRGWTLNSKAALACTAQETITGRESQTSQKASYLENAKKALWKQTMALDPDLDPILKKKKNKKRGMSNTRDLKLYFPYRAARHIRCCARDYITSIGGRATASKRWRYHLERSSQQVTHSGQKQLLLPTHSL